MQEIENSPSERIQMPAVVRMQLHEGDPHSSRSLSSTADSRSLIF
ncbi:unnamed protein product, partial [Allacma fusca]